MCHLRTELSRAQQQYEAAVVAGVLDDTPPRYARCANCYWLADGARPGAAHACLLGNPTSATRRACPEWERQ